MDIKALWANPTTKKTVGKLITLLSVWLMFACVSKAFKADCWWIMIPLIVTGVSGINYGFKLNTGNTLTGLFLSKLD